MGPTELAAIYHVKAQVSAPKINSQRGTSLHRHLAHVHRGTDDTIMTTWNKHGRAAAGQAATGERQVVELGLARQQNAVPSRKRQLPVCLNLGQCHVVGRGRKGRHGTSGTRQCDVAAFQRCVAVLCQRGVRQLGQHVLRHGVQLPMSGAARGVVLQVRLLQRATGAAPEPS